VLPWRAEVLLFSAPTFPSQVLLVARAGAPEHPIAGSGNLVADIARTRAMLGRRSLLVMEHTCLDPANYGLRGKGIDLRAYTKNTNLNEMVPALLRGDAYFTLLDVPDAVLDLQKWAGQIKVIGPLSEEQQLAAAFPRSSPELRKSFDEYLEGLRADGRYDRLVDKYYPGIRRYFPLFFARKG
jgi:ABC-type amino acid transport substrate-binding protein